MPQLTDATLAISSHTAHTLPTSASHVGDPSPTSVNHVGDEPLASTSHVESMSSAIVSHAESMSPTTVSHVGGIHMIEKPRRIGCKPKFFCRICKGNHLTRLCLATVVVQEA
jgi:hypothetical protein